MLFLYETLSDVITRSGFHREGTGIQLDAELRYGKSERCLTFDNEPLVSNGDFEVQVLEVFAFSMV